MSSQFLYVRLPIITALVLSLALSFVCATVTSRIWERRSRTAEVSFSELMIWSWYRLQKAERQLEKSLRAAESADSHEEQLQVLHELTAALESKDPYTRGHSRRVERHSFKTGVALGLPLVDVEVLRMAASLHDVGKIRVPNRVLHKPGQLSDDERSLIEEHPVLGAEMVASIGNKQIVDAVRHHHERWDGGGYPDGKAGTEIPLFARVIAVADSYDAIRSTRSYRTGASRDKAVQILTDESGHQLDAEVVDAFLTTLPARGPVVGWFTSLATGPGALWRFLEHLFHRFGSAALAPALGAVGTSVILGTTSLFTPAIPAQGYALDEPGGATSSPTTSTVTAPRDASGTRGSGGSVPRERVERRRAETRSTPSTTSPESSTQEDRPTSSPPPAPDTSDDDPAAPGDPNDQGKDCEEGSRKRSKGSRRHCG
ncbi:MAG TPA: HD-GYP domain-containing protein [Actinomycetota bacterium]|nr:HD-GYP domain-containing protein [Actinomycetota bacterium]